MVSSSFILYTRLVCAYTGSVTYGGAVLFLLFALLFFRDAWMLATLPEQELGKHDADWIPGG